MSGSMQPTIPVGALVLVKPQKSYEINDIVTYLPSSAKNKADTRTHRIISIQEKYGRSFYQTKGDANSVADSELIPPERIIGKCILTIALLGYVIGYAKTIPGLILVIVVPATIIIYEESKKIAQEIKKFRKPKMDKKRQKKEHLPPKLSEKKPKKLKKE